MKLPKAIEILKERFRIKDPLKSPDYEDALKLGIEALERLHSYRRDNWHMANIPLPSETPTN